MKKNVRILVAAVIATVTVGAATLALASKTGYTCCTKTDAACCRAQQSCCR